jgi:hypothetical protein
LPFKIFKVFKKFSGIRWFISHELLHGGNFSTLTYFKALGMQSERTAPEKWGTDSRFLLHDDSPAHRSVVIKDFLAKKNVTTMGHPPHPLDLATADFYTFTQLKPALKSRGFCDAIDIIKNATEELKRLSQNGF